MEVGVAPQSPQGMGLLKRAGVAQEEKGEGSPVSGDLGRNCLGFGSLREGYTQRHTQRQERQKEKMSVPSSG